MSNSEMALWLALYFVVAPLIAAGAILYDLYERWCQHKRIEAIMRRYDVP